MKMIMEFNLPEDQEEMTTAMNGMKYRISIEEFENHMRSRLKYGHLTAEETLILEDLRSKFFEILHQNGVTLC